MSFLEARALEVSYGQIKAVKGIDIEVKQGELVCLIGANGAGKTTALKALSGMLAPSSGEIRFEGKKSPARRHTSWCVLALPWCRKDAVFSGA